ncbi:hypothetical protein [Mesorhizobium sp.]|uniref:hypothetical protein n=1 Tax=Mesorhizobium sp. TaxID=1871066 RepID=UPI0025F6C437|nr:hypothetical protein [Mesorhizobium sp.]
MADDRPHASLDAVVKRLVEEAGISEAEALELVYLLGLNWSSLVREARVLRAASENRR